jgi:hypothetical protein
MDNAIMQEMLKDKKVAVKRLRKASGQGTEEFRNEVALNRLLRNHLTIYLYRGSIGLESMTFQFMMDLGQNGYCRHCFLKIINPNEYASCSS